MVNEEELAEYLAECPLCKSNAGFKISGFPFKKDVECKSCGAKWRWENTDKVQLKKYSKDGTGDFLLEVERPVSFWSNLNLEHIDWGKAQKPRTPILQSLILERGEEILAGWNGVSLAVGGWTGSLVLTTQRLMWLDKKEEGILNKKISYDLSYILRLENLLQIVSSSEPYWYDREKVEIKDSENRYSYKLERMQEYPSCRPLIMKAIEERKKEIESEKRKERVQLVLDFSSLKDYMEKGGLVMQTFRCPNCSAPVEFPEKGKTAKCDHCGSKIYARDIFEKIKELIG